jgi:hypothetical protein
VIGTTVGIYEDCEVFHRRNRFGTNLSAEVDIHSVPGRIGTIFSCRLWRCQSILFLCFDAGRKRDRSYPDIFLLLSYSLNRKIHFSFERDVSQAMMIVQYRNAI